jgi:sugar lactone lactonase YvrE
MSHRTWISLAIAGITATGCQAHTPVPGQMALAEAPSAPTARVLANATTAFSSVVTTIAGTGTPGFMEGPAANARFNTPQGLAIDPAGVLYVADTFNMSVRTITPTGMVITAGFPAALGKLVLPTSVAVTPMGLAVLETAKNRIQFLSPTGVVTPFVGGAIKPQGQGLLPGTYGHADGRGSEARFQSMGDLAMGTNGILYITDRNRVRMAYPDGTVMTIAGIERVGHVDGTGGLARFNTLRGLAIHPGGDVYVVDSGNHRIRRLMAPAANDPSNVLVGPVAGGEPGYADSTDARAARFMNPTDVAVDSLGNAYVTDTGNHCIRKIFPDGSVITLAGTGVAGSADGPGNAAQFSSPNGIAVDAVGNVYVTDGKNHKVRKIVQL